ncbi:hypothetical protein [Pseudomonas sp. KCJK8993]|uniref:hypothetical protein n=1 Tax=Pseudomonas sp. KCJK8993 TaxID=3344565 RepID=UPI003906545C
MISNHLSLVEQQRPISNELAAQVEQYLAAGGKIEEAQPFNYKPKPITYSNQMPPSPKPFVRRRVEPVPRPSVPLDTRAIERHTLIERVRELASDHPRCEVAMMLGVDRRTVSKIGKEFGITFKAPARGGALNLAHKQVDEARDAKLAERIKAFLELGISRRQCCGKLAIGAKAFERIVAAHGIDYPKLRQGTKQCAA